MRVLLYKYLPSLTPSHTNMSTISLDQATTISHLDYCNSSKMVFLFLSWPPAQKDPVASNILQNKVHVIDIRPWSGSLPHPTHLLPCFHLLTRFQMLLPHWVLQTCYAGCLPFVFKIHSSILFPPLFCVLRLEKRWTWLISALALWFE